jgi:nitroreductase
MTTGTAGIAELIRSRRTIHNFKPGAMPPAAEIIQAIDLAVCAPNHYATEPWRFYLIGSAAKEKICLLNAELTGAAGGGKAAQAKLDRWRAIPGWLLLTCARSTNAIRAAEDYAACCCAAQNLMLYLWSAGIGVKWTTGAVTRDPRFYAITGMDPEKETVVGLFWYGYAEEIPAGERKPAGDKIVQLA